MDEAPQSPKTFTVSQANALLERVKPLVEQLQGLQRSIARTSRQISELTAKITAGNGYPLQALQQQIDELTEHQLQLLEGFQSALQQLGDLGCLLKDLNIGLVDFYGTLRGEPVLLCWKLGEDRIRFWHGVDAGYDSRQPIEEAAQ